MIAPSARAAAGRRLRAAACSTMSTARRRRSAPAAIRRWPRRARRCRWSLTGFLTLFVAFFGYRMLFGQTPERARRRARSGQDRHRARPGDQLARLSDPGLRRRAQGAGGARRRDRPAGRPCPASAAAWSTRLDYADRAFVALGHRSAPATAAAEDRASQREPASRCAPPPFAGFDSCALGGARIALPDRRARRARGGAADRRPDARARAVLHRLPAVRGHSRAVRGLDTGARRRRARRARHVDRARRRAGPARALARRADRAPHRRLADPRRAGRIVRGRASSSPSSCSPFCSPPARVALGFRLPAGWRAAPAQLAEAVRGRAAARRRRARREPAAAGADRSRAAQVVDAVAASQRRETAPAAGARLRPAGGDGQPRGGSGSTCRRTMPPRPRAGAARPELSPPHPRPRISASAGRRDRAS